MNFSNIQSMYRFVKGSSAKRGFIYSLKIALHELWFEFRYGTDTIEIVDLNQIADVSKNEKEDSEAVYYMASYVYLFNRLMKQISKHVDQPATFIDIGAGKGRVMILAAVNGFKNVLGVEYSKELCRICEENLKKFTLKTKSETNFSTIHESVMTYEIPEDVTVVYLANPFGEPGMLAVIEQIEQSAIKAPRDIYIAYFNPLFGKLFEDNGYETLFEEYDKSNAKILQLLRKR